MTEVAFFLSLVSTALGLRLWRTRRELADTRWRSILDDAELHALRECVDNQAANLDRALKRAAAAERKHRLLMSFYREQRRLLREAAKPWRTLLEAKQ